MKISSVVIATALAGTLVFGSFMVLLADVPALADSDHDGDHGIHRTCSVASCHGRDDNDTLYGTTGNTRLKGGPGPDHLHAGSNLPETVLGNKGNDKIYVENTAPDTINCGGGHDTVYGALPSDTLIHCEHVH